MTNDETSLETLPTDIQIGESGLALRTHADVKFAAETFWKSGALGTRFANEAQVAVAILTGSEAGLSPAASVRALFPIHNIMSWETWAVRALILKSGKMEKGSKIEEGVNHANSCKFDQGERCQDACYGFFQTHRQGQATPTRSTFSVADAKRAGLWKKNGTWQTHPDRMLRHRACGFHGKDYWGDVLMGIDTRDAVLDYPQSAFVKEGETIATYTDPPGTDPLLAPAIVVPEDPGTDAQVEPTGLEEAKAATQDAAEAPGSSAELQEDGEGNGSKGDGGEGIESGADTPAPAEKGSGNPSAPSPSDAADLAALNVEAGVESGEAKAKPKAKKKAKPKAALPPIEPDSMEVCEAQGCGHAIDLGLEMSWPTPTGRRCADCGPAPKGKR
jgi:hypothetical protein